MLTITMVPIMQYQAPVQYSVRAPLVFLRRNPWYHSILPTAQHIPAVSNASRCDLCQGPGNSKLLGLLEMPCRARQRACVLPGM